LYLADEVKTVAGMILRKLYDLSLGNTPVYYRIDTLFIKLNNEVPRYIQRSLFDSGLGYAVDRKWIEYSPTANEVRITTDGCSEVLNRTHIQEI
jgi:hypothetical protein